MIRCSTYCIRINFAQNVTYFPVAPEICLTRTIVRGYIGDAVQSLHYNSHSNTVWAISQSYATSDVAAQIQIDSIDPRSGLVLAGTALPGVMNGHASTQDTLSQLYFFAQDCNGTQSLTRINLTSVLTCQQSYAGYNNTQLTIGINTISPLLV